MFLDVSCGLLSLKFDEGKPMVRKRSPTDKAAESPRIDDLKQINGIGPAVEKRLNGVGIYAFAQLAAMSPADIAAAVLGIRGLTAESIKTQDWIGQASKLAAESTVSEAQKDVEAPTVTEQVVTFTAPVEPPTAEEHAPAGTLSVESRGDTAPPMADYRPATFTVELLLDEHNNVHSTHVMHVQSRREQIWTGWPKTEFVDFLDKSAGAKTSSEEPAPAMAEEPVPPKTEEPTPPKVEEPVPAIAAEPVPAMTAEPVQTLALVAESKPLTPEAAQPGLAGTLHLRDMKITGTKSAGANRILSHEQPLDAHLVLDLSEITVPGNTSLNYKASIYGKSRVSGSGRIVGEAEGTIEPADTVTIDVKGNPLPEGIYRLAATVVLTLPGTKRTIKPGTLAVLDGGQIQVY